MTELATAAALVVGTAVLTLIATRTSRGRRARSTTRQRWQSSLAQHGALPHPPSENETGHDRTH